MSISSALSRKLTLGTCIVLMGGVLVAGAITGAASINAVRQGYTPSVTQDELDKLFSDGYEMGMEDTLNTMEPVAVSTPTVTTITEYVEVPSPPVTEYVTEYVTEVVTEYVTEYVNVPGETVYVTEEVDKDAIYDRGYERGASDTFTSFSTALLTPCATEDSDNCYWNAQAQGNGVGTSFVSVNGSTYTLN